MAQGIPAASPTSTPPKLPLPSSPLAPDAGPHTLNTPRTLTAQGVPPASPMNTLPKLPLPSSPPSRTSSKGTSRCGSCAARLPTLPPLVRPTCQAQTATSASASRPTCGLLVSGQRLWVNSGSSSCGHCIAWPDTACAAAIAAATAAAADAMVSDEHLDNMTACCAAGQIDRKRPHSSCNRSASPAARWQSKVHVLNPEASQRTHPLHGGEVVGGRLLVDGPAHRARDADVDTHLVVVQGLQRRRPAGSKLEVLHAASAKYWSILVKDKTVVQGLHRRRPAESRATFLKCKVLQTWSDTRLSSRPVPAPPACKQIRAKRCVVGVTLLLHSGRGPGPPAPPAPVLTQHT